MPEKGTASGGLEPVEILSGDLNLICGLVGEHLA